MTPKARKKIEARIIEFADLIDTSGQNGDMYRTWFKTATDKQVESIIADRVPIFAPNGSKVNLDASRNVEIARERYGYEMRQQCWLTDPKTGLIHLTEYKHIILEVPARRQSQLIEKKFKVAEHNRIIDKSTGQTTGKSKGSSFSFPQTFVMFAKGYDATIRELLQIRGGDMKAAQIVDRNIRQTGKSSQKFEGWQNTRVKSSQTLGAALTAQHIGTTLLKV